MAAILDFSILSKLLTAPHPSGYHYRGIGHEYSETKLHQTNKIYPHVLIIIVNCK